MSCMKVDMSNVQLSISQNIELIALQCEFNKHFLKCIMCYFKFVV